MRWGQDGMAGNDMPYQTPFLHQGLVSLPSGSRKVQSNVRSIARAGARAIDLTFWYLTYRSGRFLTINADYTAAPHSLHSTYLMTTASWQHSRSTPPNRELANDEQQSTDCEKLCQVTPFKIIVVSHSHRTYLVGTENLQWAVCFYLPKKEIVGEPKNGKARRWETTTKTCFPICCPSSFLLQEFCMNWDDVWVHKGNKQVVYLLNLCTKRTIWLRCLKWMRKFNPVDPYLN